MTDDLVTRLRGTYRVPVNDGAGLLNGLDYFERQFPTSKLAIEAADEIERLREAAKGQLVVVDAAEARVRELEAELANQRTIAKYNREQAEKAERELAEAYERCAHEQQGVAMSIPTVADFTSMAFHHEVVRREEYTQSECRRFHLLFAYINERGAVSSGEQIILASDMGQAAVRIAKERDVGQLFVRKRFFSNKPASEAEIVNCVFDIV